MKLTVQRVRNAAIVYMALPNALFFLFTLKWWIGITAFALVCAAGMVSCRRKETEAGFLPITDSFEPVTVKWGMAFALLFLVFVWCVMAGQGGFVAQTWDWNGRNATLRDMVMHDWPVTYRGGSLALAYYIGHWVPSALVGRAVLALGGSADAAWRIANAVLLIWTCAGVLIVLSMLIVALRGDRPWKQLLVLMLLVFFSQTKVIGSAAMVLIQHVLGGITGKNYDLRWGWWTFQFSHNSELLYWVFNQTVVPWLGILLVASERSFTRIIFIAALSLICGPIPAVGIVFFATVVGVAALCRRMKRDGALMGLTETVRSVLTFENLIGLMVVIPLVYAYLSTNSRGGTFAPAWLGKEYFWKRYLLFVCCEAGLLLAVARRAGNIWWWSALVWICICPLVKLGNNNDFCMRASIPAFMILMVLTAQAFSDGSRLRRMFVVAVLALGILHPVRMMHRYMKLTLDTWPNVPRQDRIYSYSRRLEDIQMREKPDRLAFPDALANNHCIDPYNRFFFRCLARLPREMEAGK